tara:strand:+ start:7701 stop:8102 length:402 start_codon:yes stop_codon:yes gene_type:complete
MKVIHNYNNEYPTWQEILENFNNSVMSNTEIKHNPLGFFMSCEAHKMPFVKKVLDDLKLNVAHTYINITENGDTFGRHCDDVEVYYWQVQGKTKWKFDDESHILNSGDLIIIPRGVYHNVKPLGPRVGISMSI